MMNESELEYTRNQYKKRLEQYRYEHISATIIADSAQLYINNLELKYLDQVYLIWNQINFIFSVNSIKLI